MSPGLVYSITVRHLKLLPSGYTMVVDPGASHRRLWLTTSPRLCQWCLISQGMGVPAVGTHVDSQKIKNRVVPLCCYHKPPQASLVLMLEKKVLAGTFSPHFFPGSILPEINNEQAEAGSRRNSSQLMEFSGETEGRCHQHCGFLTFLGCVLGAMLQHNGWIL